MIDKAKLAAILVDFQAFEAKFNVGGLSAADKAELSRAIAELGALLEPDVDRTELPRMVKKPGETKVVNTKEELASALAEGWVLRLEDYKNPNPAPRLWKEKPPEAVELAPEPFPDVLDDPDGVPPAAVADPVAEPADPDLASELTADLEKQEPESEKRKPGRPRKG